MTSNQPGLNLRLPEASGIVATIVCCNREDCSSQSRLRSSSEVSAISHGSSCGECEEQDFCPDCNACLDEPSCAVSSTDDCCKCRCPRESPPPPPLQPPGPPQSQLPSMEALPPKPESKTYGIPRGRKLQLWEFLFELLKSPENCRSLEWVDEEKGVFRIVSPQLLAVQWGNHRSRKCMTYDKLSRTMRYYYSKSIITKVPNMNRTYQFHYEKMKDLRNKC